MEKLTNKKSDGFLGEKMIIIPKEIINQYYGSIFVKRIYITSVGYFPTAVGHFIDRPDGTPDFIYFYCISGKGVVKIGESVFYLSKNMAICIPKNTPHSYYADNDDPWTILWAHFNGSDTSFYPLTHPKIISFLSKYSSNRMLYLFNQLFRVIESTYTVGNFIYMSHTMQMILSDTYFKNDKISDFDESNYILNTVIKYFHTKVSENLSLKNICDEFNVSKSYITAVFKKNTSSSPIKFFISLKMKEACKMLRSTTYSIKIIASDLGYLDPYYFSHVFKNTVGVSPLEYRNSDMIFY